jgi:DNA-binding transcriptional ArsR family regulator
MESKKNHQELARMFKALSADQRVRIIQLLAGRSLCVGALSDLLDITGGAVSQHLRILHDAGLVETQRRGSFIHYNVNPDAAAQWTEVVESLLNVSRNEHSGCCPKKGAKSCVAKKRNVKSRKS